MDQAPGNVTNSAAPPATLSLLAARGPVACQTPNTTLPPATASADHGPEQPHGPYSRAPEMTDATGELIAMSNTLTPGVVAGRVEGRHC
jgi:hypothetical protein